MESVRNGDDAKMGFWTSERVVREPSDLQRTSLPEGISKDIVRMPSLRRFP
jgi:hypothetical protein